MKFSLTIDPHATATKFGFVSKESTLLTDYLKPKNTGSGRGIVSILLPKNINYYKCMWCCQTPVSPIGIPIKHVNNKRDIVQVSAFSGDEFKIKEDGKFVNSFLTRGIFCCLECAKAYAQEHEHLAIYGLSCMYLQQIWMAEFGSGIIGCAPPRETLKIFGGELDWEEFHAQSNKIWHHDILTPCLDKFCQI
jgi:hypothetical protein